MKVTVLFIAIAVAGLVEQAGGEWFAAAIVVVAVLEFYKRPLRRFVRTCKALFDAVTSTKAGAVIVGAMMLAGSLAGTMLALYLLYASGLLDLIGSSTQAPR